MYFNWSGVGTPSINPPRTAASTATSLHSEARVEAQSTNLPWVRALATTVHPQRVALEPATFSDGDTFPDKWLFNTLSELE